MKIMIIGVGKLGSTVAYTILRELQPKKMILNDIVDLYGEKLDLQHACKGFEISTEIITDNDTEYRTLLGTDNMDYLIITAGIPRTKNIPEQQLGKNVEIINHIIWKIQNNFYPINKDTKIIMMTNPVLEITKITKALLEEYKIYNPEEELMKMRDDKELGWEIVKSKGYTNWGPAVSVVNLIKRLEGIN